MPELAEVQTIVDQLNQYLINKQITKIDTYFPLYLTGTTQDQIKNQFEGRRVASLTRRGKKMIWTFKDLDDVWVGGLGMTGRYTWRKTNTQADPKHLAQKIAFPNGVLLYTDMRRFSHLHVFPNMEAAEKKQRFGLDAWTHSWTTSDWRHILDTKKPIKAVLLDQSKIGGIGNYLADEILFQAGLLPTHQSNSVTQSDIDQLDIARKQVIATALTRRGLTFSDYRGIFGEAGQMKSSLQVYGRKGKNCFICKTPLELTKVAGRTSAYCPNCQY